MTTPLEQRAGRKASTMGPPIDTRPATTTLRAALASTVAATAAPYGYTVTFWSSGALLVRAHGVPRVSEVFAFAAGALLAFSLLAVLVRSMGLRWEPLDNPGSRVVAGALNWVAVGAAVGAVALLATIHGWAAWPVSSFAATFLYLITTSTQLALMTSIGNR